MSALRGRRSECDALDELLDRVRSGNSATLVLCGEAGVGKTELLHYLIGCATGAKVLRAAGIESEMELAYASLHQLCSAVLDRRGRLPPPQRAALETVFGLDAGPVPDPLLIGLAVLGLLSEAAEERPLICVVDDAQWVDRASAQALAFAARRLHAEAVGVIFATRDPSDMLSGLPELRVHGLAHHDARELLQSVIPWPVDGQVLERLVAETRGNPLALLELSQTLSPEQLAGGFGRPDAGELSHRLEQRFVRQIEELPDETRMLLTVAAADPLGEPRLFSAAAGRLGTSADALSPAETAGLVEVADRVRFRHPLIRSAAYRAATSVERREVHAALAEVTDPDRDPARRAWHRAQAAACADETVASELEQAAATAQSRGGFGAAAAFLELAVGLTPDPAQQAERALAAAQASLYAGAFDGALRQLADVQAKAVDELQRARIDLLHAQIMFASGRGREAPGSLLRAVKGVEPLDPRLARAGYLEALSAALFAARLAPAGASVRDVARAVQDAPARPGPHGGADLLLDGWAAMFADGCAAAAPTLQAALRQFEAGDLGADELQLLWLVDITAPVVWDYARWEALSRLHVELARTTGALSELPLALNSRSYIHLFRGELDTAGALIDEAAVALEATKASLTPWGAIALASMRGRLEDASTMLEVNAAEASDRGEGISLTVIAWARALLYNGLGRHDEAFAAAREAVDCPTNSAAAAWGMAELIEAAERTGARGVAVETAERFAEIAQASGTDWALGVNARSAALLCADAQAEPLYLESLDRLGRSQMRVDLARAHLLYGEWLRRADRRADARGELRIAHDQFTAIGMEAFAGRARLELAAAGERIRRPEVESHGALTAQERQIAQLARDGLSNPEIGTRLFISPRTVEWHLRKVYTKLGVASRNQLAQALPASDANLAAA